MVSSISVVSNVYLLKPYKSHPGSAITAGKIDHVVASWLVRSSTDRAVRVRILAGGHCVVLLGKTLYSHSASLHPGV